MSVPLRYPPVCEMRKILMEILRASLTAIITISLMCYFFSCHAYVLFINMPCKFIPFLSSRYQSRARPVDGFEKDYPIENLCF